MRVLHIDGDTHIVIVAIDCGTYTELRRLDMRDMPITLCSVMDALGDHHDQTLPDMDNTLPLQGQKLVK